MGILMQYNRTNIELEAKACKWWPEYLVALEADASTIPMLLKSQDEFISILTLSNSNDLDSVFKVIVASNFPANLFLKHLMILADFGSEPLQRINRDFSNYFPNNKINFTVNGMAFDHLFTKLPASNLNNTKMRTSANHLTQAEDLTPLYKDIIILLLYGSNSTDDTVANIFQKCMICNLIGKPDELKEYIKQRYIFVSRIINGAKANELGNAAQVHVQKYIRERLDHEYIISSNGHIPGITHNDGRTLTTFDLSIEKKGKYVVIEISFQVTTNSTIERKAGQAQARFVAVQSTGNYIAYIIDGAGNFQRKSALTSICDNSHCTVAYTNTEFDTLIRFIQEKLG